MPQDGFSMMGMGGMGGMMMDPAVMPFLQRQQYAQALLGQGMQTEPIRSPWQAVARAFQGGLGGYEMGAAQQGMARTLAQQQAQALADITGGAPAAQPSAAMAGPQPVPQGAAAPPPVPVQQQALADPRLQPAIDAAAKKYGIAPQLIASQIQQESGGNVGAVSKAGAIGPMQILPSTAANPGFGMNPISPQDLQDPAKNIDFGVNYMVARGKARFGDQWDPNNLDQLRQTYNDYSGGAAGYPDAVIRGAGVAPAGTQAFIGAAGSQPAAADGAAGGAPVSGLEMSLRMREQALRMSVSGNPYEQRLAPMMMQNAVAMMNLGAWSPPQVLPNGQYGQINTLTGEFKPSGDIPRPETRAAQVIGRVNAALNAGQKPNPTDLSEYGPSWTIMGYGQKTEFNPTLGRTITFTPNPPPYGYRPPEQVMGGPAPQGAAAAPGAAAPTPAAAGGAAAPAPASALGAAPSAPPGGAAQQPVPGPTEPAARVVPEVVRGRMSADQKEIDDSYEESTSDAAQRIKLSTNAVLSNLPNVQTGAGTDLRLGVAQILQALGAPQSTIQSTLKLDTSNAELLQKNLLNNVTQQMEALGGQRAAKIFEKMQSGLPSLGSRPATIDTMTRLIQLSLMRASQRADALNDYVTPQLTKYNQTGNPADYTGQRGFDAQFDKTHDPRIYVAAAEAAGGQPYNVWAGNLDRGQRDAVRNLALQAWPDAQIYDPQGISRAAPGAVASGRVRPPLAPPASPMPAAAPPPGYHFGPGNASFVPNTFGQTGP